VGRSVAIIVTPANVRHPRESGDPFLGFERKMDSRVRGNDEHTGLPRHAHQSIDRLHAGVADVEAEPVHIQCDVLGLD
jgi:hypothetical protein